MKIYVEDLDGFASHIWDSDTFVYLSTEVKPLEQLIVDENGKIGNIIYLTFELAIANIERKFSVHYISTDRIFVERGKQVDIAQIVKEKEEAMLKSLEKKTKKKLNVLRGKII